MQFVINTINTIGNHFYMKQENLFIWFTAEDVKHDFVEAKAVGDYNFMSFVQEQVTNLKSGNFKSMNKTNLKTFGFGIEICKHNERKR